MVTGQNRDKVIVRTSVIGIVANALLAAFKAFIGLISHSVAVVLDAVNNLSDALSSLITIIGTKIAHRSPDRKHPLGHGRTEYISATVIAIIVLYAGITSLIESVKSIINPVRPSYSVWALVVIGVAVGVKLVLGSFVKRTGESVDSDALKNSGSDALFDAIISASTLVAALIFKLTDLSLEAYLAALISLYIIKSGIEMLRDTLSEIIGQRVEPELARSVKASITSFEEVRGAYDLIIHNYGPERLIASVHIELNDTMTVGEADALERHISDKVFSDTGVILTGISVYSVNTHSGAALELENRIRSYVNGYEHILELHGFYIDEATKTVRFDIIIGFDEKDRQGLYQKILAGCREMEPEYDYIITLDYDISD